MHKFIINNENNYFYLSYDQQTRYVLLFVWFESE